ncbi:glycosyltransferase family 2 protein [Streptomyces sp. cg28]|uniref:glycosyltransferase family 2 protein n=1 Tax=Streptomyces sp. cg28 TaxID=3403457 RepID=UPI003B21A556
MPNSAAPAPSAPDVTLAWCAGADVATMFLESVAHLYEDDAARARIAGHIAYIGGPDLRTSRTSVTRSFLKTGTEWLLQIDSDMFFTPQHFRDLLSVADAATCPIVGGYYAGYTPHNGEKVPVAATLQGDDVQVVRRPHPSGVVDVDFVGTGFLLIHRDVFRRVAQDRPGSLLPWWDLSVAHGMAMPEDFTFCARARQAGYKVRLHTGVRLGHVKTHIVFP